VMNAVVDALWRAQRISHVDMPATSDRVWSALNGSSLAAAARARQF
jgi:aerobic carbon-monoxide dehydrogenase large subunit